MSRIAYVNGRYVAHRDAQVHIEDRGYQFADGCYEVVAMQNGVFIDAGLHLQRLRRSLAALRIEFSVNDAALMVIMTEIARRNLVREGYVYMQITRGVASRDFAFPGKRRPSLVMTARSKLLIDPKLLANGIKVITIPDQRWARPDIKSVALLPNALGKEQAKQAGAYEAWQVDRDGNVTEGTSSNAWIVTKASEVVTRQADQGILNGVTRLGLLRVIGAAGLKFVERAFSVAEAKHASEALLTSSTNFVVPVVRIDDTPVGDGKPGALAKKLAASYADYAALGGSDRART
ncbi:MAG TPA: D-amino-acid transaminase [Stellaceae bacterium]|jgi:D-alanine transaminase|nr:D-amino-acid transaminase [Stellaceae bacterium]